MQVRYDRRDTERREVRKSQYLKPHATQYTKIKRKICCADTG